MSAAAKGRPRLLDPRALARIKGLALRSRLVVDGVLQGLHKSPHHGSSIEFAEHKEYTPGDDTRHIDWKAYGRVDKVYVKKFEQETNLRAFTVLDVSASMGYGADGALTKLEYASVLAASLGFLLLRQQDALGLVAFAGQVETALPARARMSHLSHFCANLEATQARGPTRIDVGLRRVVEQARKRGVVHVYSDFFGDDAEAFALLRQLVTRGHQVTVFHTLDGEELDFPFEEMTVFQGMESNQRLLVEPKLVRDAYLERMTTFREGLRRRCLADRVQYVLADTREPPENLLLRYLTGQDAARGGRGGGR
ncbi:MAG: DUF58 domain-containing protein [Deltaproteobacteria bacterium]|nr:DUF58 domain-containing protein [Deltaproteobacteria bacterium]MCB9787169.1 DUF58 domain-containing protein [Deltaproteobacteria bacterium]